MSIASNKTWLLNRFEGCLVLAYARDPYRNRDVRLLMLPNEYDVVGVNDGVDVWFAPVIADPFRVRIQALLESVRNGTFRPPPDPNQRHRILLNDRVPLNMRPKIETPPATTTRRRIIHVQA